MTRRATTLAALVLCAAPLAADVTLQQTMTTEGGASQMMGAGAMPQMQMTTRIKGLKSRIDVEVMGQRSSTIADLTERRILFVDHGSRTVRALDPASVQPGSAPVAMPDVQLTSKPTGQTRVIEGAPCTEHTFTVSVNMGEATASAQMPAEGAAMMKDVQMKMNGSLWVATSGPGVADYLAFQKAAADSKLLGALAGAIPGQQRGGMDRLAAAATSTPGLPYLTEMTMSFEGTGKIVEVMNQMAPTKMVHRTTAVSTEAIPDEVFEVPKDYKVVAQ